MKVTVSELGLSPGKSMRSIELVESLDFNSEGMFGDREYMWVEGSEHQNILYHPGETVDKGRFLSQREDPVLTSIGIAPTTNGLYLDSDKAADVQYVPRVIDSRENQIPVSVWGWNGIGVDQGDKAANWGEEVIGRSVRLVSVSNDKPRYVEDNKNFGRVGFADGFPLLVTSIGSIATLNEYLSSVGKPEVPADRFRANIILDGLEPFEEDYLDSFQVSSCGLSLTFKRIKACGRCPIPDTDQITGERKTHVRSALGKIGRAGVHSDTEKYGDKTEIFFGQNFIVNVDSRLGETEKLSLRKDQEVSPVFVKNPNWYNA